MITVPYTQEDYNRFWIKVAITANPDKCWEWTGSFKGGKYGKFMLGGKGISPHRLSYFFSNKSIDPNLCCLHKCDNPPCVNPNHLFLGTPKDNAVDRMNKGRGGIVRGGKNATSKLTPQQVLEIRNRYSKGERQIPLSKEFGVTQAQISLIVRREQWWYI